MVGRAVSPHPDPLPQGEGTTRIAQCSADGSGLYSAESRIHPLPKGEAWGEGEETTALRSGNLQDLSCGQCPLRYLVLSHSRFQGKSLTESVLVLTRTNSAAETRAALPAAIP